MINKLSSLKQLPYKTYVSILLKDESKLEKAKDIELDGYYLITKGPRMVILFLEYNEGKYNEISKKVWNLL